MTFIIAKNWLFLKLLNINHNTDGQVKPEFYTQLYFQGQSTECFAVPLRILQYGFAV